MYLQRQPHQKSQWAKRPPAWLLASVVAAFLFTVVAGYCWAATYSIYHPKPFDPIRLTQAVRWVQVNKRDVEGEIVLPPALASVSIDGRAYVTDGMIFFPRWTGRKMLAPLYPGDGDGWIEGYCFSAQPLTTLGNSPAGSDDFFLMMDFGPAHTRGGEVCGQQMAVGERLQGSWYSMDSFS